MQSQGFSAPVPERQKLEELWRARLDHAVKCYQAATNEYRNLLQEEPDGRPPSPDSPFARARQAESGALMEYSRVLKIFTDLMVHGKTPDEYARDSAVPSAGGVSKMIAVVDDDESIRDSTKTLLRSSGYQVSTFESAERFLNSDATAQAECVILDVRMPGMDGLELQQRLNASQAGIPIIFVTAHGDARTRRLAMDRGAVDFLFKPFCANELVSAVQTALNRREVDRRGA
jgi:CheY-like chemotaxis protein